MGEEGLTSKVVTNSFFFCVFTKGCFLAWGDEEVGGGVLAVLVVLYVVFTIPVISSTQASTRRVVSVRIRGVSLACSKNIVRVAKTGGRVIAVCGLTNITIGSFEIRKRSGHFGLSLSSNICVVGMKASFAEGVLIEHWLLASFVVRVHFIGVLEFLPFLLY